MCCERALDLISVRLDGPLTEQETAELTDHLNTCPECRAISEQLQQLHTALDQVGQVEAPAELSRSVMAQIAAERRGARRRLIRRLSGLAACLALSLGVFRMADAGYFDHNQPSADLDQPSMARLMGPQPVALNRLEAYSLPVSDAEVEPFAYLLNSEDGLERFLAQLPQTDLSEVKDTYRAEFFAANRLLAVVVQEPSSSITHQVTELTQERVVLLRDVPETGDSDMALWVIFSEVAGTGPETALNVELISN